MPGPIGNTSAQKHGGEAATKAISRGDPFTGLAADQEKQVEAHLAASGRAGMVERNAIRAQTAADLYWSAVLKAADERNLEALDRYIARFGWLVGVAGRAWDQVGKLDPERSRNGARQVLEALAHE